VQVEVLSIDGNALSRSIKDRLTEAELRSAYENRKSEFEVRPRPGDLPVDLFAGQPELTPPVVRPFEDVRSILAPAMAEEKAQAEIEEKFDRVKRDVLDKFYDEYQDALDAREEAQKEGSKSLPPLPEPGDLKELAKRENLNYELSPMLSREDAEHYGQIKDAQVGLSRIGDGRKFPDEFFDPKTPLYESVTLSDVGGTRYLARKVKDAAPRVPPLDEVRPQVSLAWKTEQARPLAKEAADQVAKQLKNQGTPPKDATYQGYPVATIPAIARKFSPFNLSPTNPYRMSEPEETPISEVPSAGEAFREAYFGLQPGAVAVAPNQPETSYYVMTLERRDPATFAALYAPAGDEYKYKSFAKEQADRQLVEGWLGWLRHQAGVPDGWVPADEAREKEQAENRG
jgi:peptidyl-prolyl cis-trans isomerase D